MAWFIAAKHLDGVLHSDLCSSVAPHHQFTRPERSVQTADRLSANVRPGSLNTGSGPHVGQVVLLLPLVAAFGYNGQVEGQKDDPVAGVQDGP